MQWDLGDVVAFFELRVKGLRRYKIAIHVGVPTDTSPEDRVIQSPPYFTGIPEVSVIMDLQADKKVPLSLEWTDEMGNPVPAPAGFSATYTVDDPSVISLTDNGDGTAVAAAVGVLGTANVHVVASFDGVTLSGDLQIVVVAGLAERLNIVAGPPEETTPDEPTP